MSENNEIQGTKGDVVTTIPILLGDKVKTDSEEWYFLRLTPGEGTYLVTNIIELLKSLADGKYIVCTESSSKGKLHYHIVFLSYKDPREDVKLWLLEYYPDKWGKADGNKRYNLKVCDDLDKSISYTVKDGRYFIGDDINSECVAVLKKKSYSKFSRVAYQNELDDLYSKYKVDNNAALLRVGIIQLYGKYGKRLCLKGIDEMVLSYRVQVDPNLAYSL